MNLPLRIQAIVLAGVLALLAAQLLITAQAERSRQADIAAQLDGHLLQSLRATTENFLATGLQLEQMDALQGVIEREQAAFARIVAIDVFAASGSVLYSTDADSRGRPVPEEWRQHLAEDRPWRGESLLLRQIGQRFDNDLGQAAGGIVVTLSTASEQDTLERWKESGQRLLRWLLLAALSVAAAWAGIYWGLRHLLRPYREAGRILHGAADAKDTPLAQAATRRYAHWLAAREDCRQRMARLEEMDHEI